jgi:hypothetical protein
MAMIATVYEKYRDVDEATPRHRRAVTTMALFDQQEVSSEMRQPWSGPKHPLQYFIKENEGDVHLQLASGMTEYIFVSAGTEPGVTYTLGSIIPPVIVFELEEEFDFVVKMTPKAVRKIIVKITARNKGIPNPIL